MELKNLTIAPRTGNKSIEYLEDILEDKLTDNFKIFMKKYAGLSVIEDFYEDKNGNQWELQTFDDIMSISKLTKEFKENGWGSKMPFAYDPGGWHYCISYEVESYHKIIVNRWTDHLPEEQFLIIADSFEEFINGLHQKHK